MTAVPVLEPRGGIVRVFSGGLAEAGSPAEHFSDLVGADLEIHRDATLNIPLRPDFEYAVLLLTGPDSRRNGSKVN